MKRLTLTFGLLLTFLAGSAFADGWQGSIGYTQLSDDDEGIDVSLGAVTGSVSYRFDNSENFAIIPEFRLGFGLSDDTITAFATRFDVKIKTFYGFTVRGEYAFNESVYVFAQPTYANLDIEVSSGGISASEDEWEFGFGGGVGFNVGERGSIEVFIEDFDGTLAVTGAYRHRF
ncbi:MAG: outer membrane beta-barrel protein [Pseudomonadales bacterium]